MLRQVFFKHIPKMLSRGLSSGLCGGQSRVWKCCLMLPELLFHNLSLMNSDFVILVYHKMVREGNTSTDGKTWSFSTFRWSADLFFGKLKQLQMLLMG